MRVDLRSFQAFGQLSGCGVRNGSAGGLRIDRFSEKGKPERGPDGTVAYLVQVETSEPGARIEANGEYIGTSPVTLKIFGDRDGTFHNFGRFDYTVTALPSHPGQFAQTKVFRTGGWFTPEDRVPRRIYFEMQLHPATTAAPTPAQPSAAPLTQSTDDVKLMLFGGENHDVYLGCLSCDEAATDSIFNKTGKYGKRQFDENIWNKFGGYGSRFSNLSPWNRFAQEPPVIVDPDGRFYGRFTVNTLHIQRTRLPEVHKLLNVLSED